MRRHRTPLRRSRHQATFHALRIVPLLDILEERTLLTLQAVSLANPALFGASANGQSSEPSISDDGQLVAFQSDAANLVDGVTSTTNAGGILINPTQVYVGNLTSDSTTLASQGPTTSNETYPTNPILSANGQFVLFYSANPSLASGQNPPGPNLFETNLQNGTISLVAGSSAGSPITQVSVSANGRYVAFVTTAGNVTASPAVSSGTITNVYVRDMVAGTTTLASVNVAGTDGGDGNSSDSTISADGSEVVFQSDANNLVAQDTNNATDVFVRNLTTGVTSLVSANQTNTVSGDFASFSPVLSGDGNHVVFLSHADDLQSIHKHNLFVDVYERDLTTAVTTLISVNTAGIDSILGDSSNPIVSANGRYVAFENEQVVTLPVSASQQLYVRDTQANTTTMASVNAAGTAGTDAGVTDATFSADGSMIAFVSTTDDLVSLPTNGHQNVFVRDLTTGVTSLVSVNASGTAGGDNDSDPSFDVSGAVAMTPDGTHIVFVSTADDLLAGDNNGQSDVFVRDLTTGTTRLVSTRAADQPLAYTSDVPSFLGALSGHGQFVAMNSSATPGDGNVVGTPSVRDLQTGTTFAPDPNNQQGFFPTGVPAGAAVLSSDGSVMAFQDALLPASAHVMNVYSADVPGGAPVLVSVNAAGTGAGNAPSYGPIINGAGNIVVFTSAATNLTPGFVQGQSATFDLYARNLTTGVTSLVSMNAAGTGGGDNSTGVNGADNDTPGASVDNQDTGYDYSISADGRYVAFSSAADDLTSIDTSGNGGGIYVRDLKTGTTQLVDVAPDGVSPANGASSNPIISANGQYVVFSSKATNLVAGLSLFGNKELYVRDLQTGATRLASVDPSGNPLIATVGATSISANGQIIAFEGVSQGTTEIYAYNFATGLSQVVGVNTAGALPTYNAAEESYDEVMADPVVSADGSTVGFITNADNFAPNTTGVAGQLYLRNLQAGTTTLISANQAGTGGGHTVVNNGSAGFQGVTNYALSTDASTVAFTSDQYDLVNNEYDLTTNVYVYQSGTTATTGGISGQAFNDLNGNGKLDTGEPGLAGWTIYLDTGNVGHYVQGDPTATTNANGNYVYTNLSPGAYTVGEVVQAGYQQTAPAAPGTQTVTVTAGQTSTGPSFGDQALPPDLALQTITVPNTIEPGQSASGISYTVMNQGEGAALGDWEDAVYISTSGTIDATATLLAVEPHTGGLAAGSSYTVSLSGVTIPALAPDGYHILVQVDRRGQVAEPASEKAHETGDSTQAISLTVPTLTVGTPANGGFTAPGQDQYYQVTVSPGVNLLLTLASAASSGTLSLSERFGLLPVPGSTDETTIGTSGPNQTVAISPTQAGTYYIDVHSESGAAALAGFTLTATTPALSLVSASPAAVGNAGPSTIAIDGPGFAQNTQYALIGPGGTIAAQSVQSPSGSTAFATFNLTGVTTGAYTLQATAANGAMTSLAGAVTVRAGTGAHLVTTVSGPANVRVGRVYAFTITYSNTGDADAVAPLLQIEAPADTPIGLAPDAGDLSEQTVQVMALSPNGGPAGILRPGAQGTVTIYFQAPSDQPTITVDTTTADDATPMEYSQFSAKLQGPDDTAAQWAAVYAAFQQEIGPTTGDYVQMLARNATLMPAGQGDNADAYQLAQQQLNVATAAVTTSISGTITSADPTVSLGGLTVIALDTTTGGQFSGVTLNDGSFAIPNVDPGTYQFSVANAVIGNTPTATVASGQAVTGVGIDVNNGDVIAGQVTTAATGFGVQGATVQAVAADGTTSQVLTQPDGFYTLSGLSAGSYTLVVQATGLAEAEISAVTVSAAPAVQNVILAEGATLTGSFTLGAGGPTGGTPIVIATPTGSTDLNQVYAGTVTGSSFSIPGLPAGTYDVSVSLNGYLTGTIPGVVVAQGVTQSAGLVALALAATVSGTLTSTDPSFPAAGTIIEVLSGTSVVGVAAVGSDGSFTITGLAPGTYTFGINSLTDMVTGPDVTLISGQALTGAAVIMAPIITPGFAIQPFVANTQLFLDFSALEALKVHIDNIELIDTEQEITAAFTALQNQLPSSEACPECHKLLAIAINDINFALLALKTLQGRQVALSKILTNDLNTLSSKDTGVVDALAQATTSEKSNNYLNNTFAQPAINSANQAFDNYKPCLSSSGGPCGNPKFPFPNPFPNPSDPLPTKFTPDPHAGNDPNEKTGPGFGAQGFVTAGASLPYQIGFENEPTATATVQVVTVTDQLNADVDWTTFALGDITFGSNVVDVPAGLQSYSTTVTTTNSDGTPLLVDVSAGINLATGLVTWSLESVDPATGQLPVGINDGILGPENGTGNGTGSVAYTIDPKAALANATSFTNTASVVFDTNAPVVTDTVTNTIDSVPPTTTVTALPTVSSTTLHCTGVARTTPAGPESPATMCSSRPTAALTPRSSRGPRRPRPNSTEWLAIHTPSRSSPRTTPATRRRCRPAPRPPRLSRRKPRMTSRASATPNPLSIVHPPRSGSSWAPITPRRR